MSLSASEAASKKPIIFFDGYCILCNWFIDFIYRRDKKQRFYFASLQGQTAAILLKSVNLERVDSVMYLVDGHVEIRSTAGIHILRHLGGIYRIVIIFMVVPRPLRDFVYDWVARHRYSWFGRREQCRVPTPEDQARILP